MKKKITAPRARREWFREDDTGIAIVRRPSFEEYHEQAKRKSTQLQRLPWVIGDLLNIGDDIFGHDAAQAWDFKSYKAQTLSNYASVARRIPHNRRHPDVPFSSHEVIAPMNAAEQKKWLRLCAENEWTREQLREEVAKAAGTFVEDGEDEEREENEKRPKTFGEKIDAAVELLRDARSTARVGWWIVALDSALEAIKRAQERDADPGVTGKVTGISGAKKG